MSKTKKRSDGRYCRQVYVGKDEIGKRKYKTIYAETTKEADCLAAEYSAALGRGLRACGPDLQVVSRPAARRPHR